MITLFSTFYKIKLSKKDNMRVLKILAGVIVANIIFYIFFSYLAFGHL